MLKPWNAFWGIDLAMRYSIIAMTAPRYFTGILSYAVNPMVGMLVLILSSIKPYIQSCT